MTVELLKTLSLVSFILAGVLFLVAVALFFLLGVPRLFGDVTGSTARKAIENIRQQNAESGDKAYKPSPVNAARGKITDKISPSGKLQQRTAGIGGSPGTEKISTAKLAAQANETMVLKEQEYGTSGETVALEEQVYGTASETAVLSEPVYGASGETEVLRGPGYGMSGGTEVPGEDTRFRQPENTFQVELELGFLASTELIE